MARFKKEGTMETPELATTSLPDIIFMLIFFFMVTTSMRQATLMVRQVLPMASEVKKLENKSLVSYINIGAPRQQYERLRGTAPQLQLNDQFATIDGIEAFIASERETKSEADQALMTTAMKIDENVKMGIVTDTKQALRRCGALKISYTTRKGDSVF